MKSDDKFVIVISIIGAVAMILALIMNSFHVTCLKFLVLGLFILVSIGIILIGAAVAETAGKNKD
jgi:hypothetical protein